MTAWDMVSIYIVTFTFQLAFWALVDGGVLVGLLFLFWIVKKIFRHMAWYP